MQRPLVRPLVRALVRGLVASAVAAPVLGPYLDVTVAPYLVHGAKRMVSGYDGPLFRLRNSGGTQQDFAAVVGDLPDYAAIDTFAGGNALTCVTVYDQTGNSRNRTQATVANQPSFSTAVKRGTVAPVLFDGIADNQTTPAVIAKTQAATVSLNKQTLTVFNVKDSMRGQMPTGYMTMESAGTTHLEMFSSARFVTLRDSAANISHNVGFAPISTPAVIGIRQSATAQAIWQRGVQRNNTKTVVSQAIDTITWGRSVAGGSGYNGRFASFATVVYDVTLTDPQAAVVIASLNSVFGISETYAYRWILSGDSIEAGTGSSLLNNALRQVPLARNGEIYNAGIHGNTQATTYTNRVAYYGTLFTSAYGAGNCIITVEAGTNDLEAGTTATALYTTTTDLVTYLKGLGYKVAVFTVLPRTSFGAPGGAKETERLAYNALVRTNAAAAEYVADQAGDATIGNTANVASLTVDGTHYNSVALAIRAQYLLAAATALLGAAP